MELDLASSIRANTAAVQALTLAIQHLASLQSGTPAGAAVTTEIAKVSSQQTEAPKPLTFDDIKPLVFKVAQINRDGLVKLLGEMGVKKAAEVPAANLPAFKQKLEQLEAA